MRHRLTYPDGRTPSPRNDAPQFVRSSSSHQDHESQVGDLYRRCLIACIGPPSLNQRSARYKHARRSIFLLPHSLSLFNPLTGWSINTIGGHHPNGPLTKQTSDGRSPRVRHPYRPSAISNIGISKFLLIATLFKCLDPALTIAAALNSKSPFVSPFGLEQEADRAKISFRTGAQLSLPNIDSYEEQRPRISSPFTTPSRAGDELLPIQPSSVSSVGLITSVIR